MKSSEINHCQTNRTGAADMKAEEIVLIRQAITYSVTCLEIRLADSILNGVDPFYTERNLDTAKKALAAALRLI